MTTPALGYPSGNPLNRPGHNPGQTTKPQFAGENAPQPSGAQAPKPTARPQASFGSTMRETFNRKREEWQGFISEPGLMEGIQKAGDVLAHSIDWGDAFKEATPDSSRLQRMTGVLDLTYAAFREGFLSKTDEGKARHQRQAVYDVYSNLVQRFPLLAVQSDLPSDISEKLLELAPQAMQASLSEKLIELRVRYDVLQEGMKQPQAKSEDAPGKVSFNKEEAKDTLNQLSQDIRNLFDKSKD